MLNVIVGLVLIFLLYSLFATTILELLASFLSLRGRNLEKTIRNMLDNGTPEFFEGFKDNPMYRQLAGHFVGKTSPPSYLTSEKFRSILFEVLGHNKEGNKLVERVEGMPDGPLKSVLRQLLEDARHDQEEFRQKVELWFNDVMDRASGWYKRNIQRILVVLGMGIALAFNVDSFEIYGKLSRDPDTAQKLALEAATVVKDQPDASSIQKEALNTLSESLEVLKSPLGIGWETVSVAEMGMVDWVLKIFGWFVTALAISLGAPFWFDLLKKMVNIRSSGKAVEAKS